jgi:hypothetical protein
MTFKPIATAPKIRDHTLILAIIINGDVLEIFTGVWDMDEDGCGWVSHQHCDVMFPTHWMELSLPNN